MIQNKPMTQHHYVLYRGSGDMVLFAWLAAPGRKRHEGKRWTTVLGIWCGAPLEDNAPVVLKCRGCGVELKVSRESWDLLRADSFVIPAEGKDVWWRCEQCINEVTFVKKQRPS